MKLSHKETLAQLDKMLTLRAPGFHLVTKRDLAAIASATHTMRRAARARAKKPKLCPHGRVLGGRCASCPSKK